MLPGIRTVFKSRWHALFWAAGILWFAYEVAGTAPSTSPDIAQTARDRQAAEDAREVERMLAGKF